jgi:hypothetical protein
MLELNFKAVPARIGLWAVWFMSLNLLSCLMSIVVRAGRG